MQHSLEEILLLPSSEPTSISSRSQVNPFTPDDNLPIFVSPMTSVIDSTNYKKFKKHKLIPIIPRGSQYNYPDEWNAFSLNEVNSLIEKHNNIYSKILIDIANGHQKRLYDIVTELKTNYPNTEVMIGNIAHPKMYLECCKAGVDFCRCGIGGGSACTTSVQTGIHASLLWIIEGIKEIQKHIITYPNGDIQYVSDGETIDLKCITKTIADGGISNIGNIVKCVAIGYDYVMMGKMFAMCEESCGEKIMVDGEVKRIYYGMSSKRGQLDISNNVNKNSEGIMTFVDVNTNLQKLTDKIDASLRSAMSYIGAKNIEELHSMCKYDLMSESEFKSYNKYNIE